MPWVKRERERRVAGDLRAGHDGAADAGADARRGHDDGCRFRGRRGRYVPFVLTYGPSHLPVPAPIDSRHALQDTEEFWTEWASRCTYEGEHRDLVMRSLITLKALTYAPTGGIVAAPTTSLPEKLGGSRATGITASAGCATRRSRCWR